MRKVSLSPGIICLLGLQKYKAARAPSCFDLCDAVRIINPVQSQGGAIRYQGAQNHLTIQTLNSSHPFMLPETGNPIP